MSYCQPSHKTYDSTRKILLAVESKVCNAIRGEIMHKNLLAGLVVAPLLVATSMASAATYGFSQITNNGAPAIASQLQVDVTQSGSNVLFKLTNSSIIASSITEVYFDYGTPSSLLYFSSVSNDILGIAGESTGVSFHDGSDPSNLPSGNSLTPSFSVDASGESPNATSNGVNAASEYVKFLGTVKSGVTFDNVIAGLNSGLLRIGLHVRGIGGGTSESFINNTTPNPVPLPAAAWLFGSALLGFASLYNRRKNQN